jgi:hypothetical protein
MLGDVAELIFIITGKRYKWQDIDIYDNHPKKKYTREEVEDLIYSAMKDRAYTTTAFFNEWVDKNM